MNQNVFSGGKAIQAYLNPDNHLPLPLVELPASFNPHREKGVRIFLKLMHFLPLANVKSLSAYSMLDEADQTGKLAGVRSLVESSSGNTALSLAVLGQAFGVPKTLALASYQVEQGKLQLLRFLGTEIRLIKEDICPDPSDPNSGVNQAKRMGELPGWFNAGQYHNLANPKAHERWTGPQIWSQTDGKVTLIVSGLGTTGTICGAGAYLKSKKSTLRTLGVIREPNNLVPGVRTKALLNEVKFDWKSIVDDLVPIGTRPAYETSLSLCRSGLLVGPSSGFALAGLYAHLATIKQSDLDQMRNEDGEVFAVVIAPDSPFPYIGEYFRYLGEQAFPKIENEDLLEMPITHEEYIEFENYAVVDLTPEQCLADAYRMSRKELAAACDKGTEIPVRPPKVIIDVRTIQEFKDHHLPGSDLMPYEMLDQNLNSIIIPAFKQTGLQPIFVCAYGAKSAVLALKARKMGIEARNLKGGTLEWSRLGFPRIKGVNCAPT